MKITTIYINKVKVCLLIQQLLHHENGKVGTLVCSNEYICYFKFSEPKPTDIGFGELILDENRKIKLFNSIDEAEIFAMEYIEKKIRH